MQGRQLMAASLAAVAVLLLAGHVASGREAVPIPFIAGGASEPVTVKSGEMLSFQVKGQDRDYDAQLRAIPDQVYLAPGSNEAMVPGTMIIREERPADGQGRPTGEVVWTVTGRAARTAESKPALVTFLLWDGRPDQDPRADPPIIFSQTVVLEP